eukprot:3097822-Pyramimonas_sp.AAC.1
MILEIGAGGNHSATQGARVLPPSPKSRSSSGGGNRQHWCLCPDIRRLASRAPRSLDACPDDGC